jgi:hypothetical protein
MEIDDLTVYGTLSPTTGLSGLPAGDTGILPMFYDDMGTTAHHRKPAGDAGHRPLHDHPNCLATERLRIA